MADITIVTSAAGEAANARSNRLLVFTSSSVGYFFYVDNGNDFSYKKTSDGGQTWGSAVVIRTGTVTAFGVWYDQWTNGDTGTKIHTCYCDSGTSNLYYQNLDTSTDTLGGEVTATGATVTTGISVHLSIAKMRGGNLLIAYVTNNSGTSNGLLRSTDGGSTWSSRTTPFESTSIDTGLIFPGNESDNQDAWILFQDSSANAVTLKVYDDSANTVTESSTIVTVAEATTDGTSRYCFSGSIRFSDDHLIFAAATDQDTASADMVVYDVTDISTWSALTEPISNKDDWYYPGLFIDQTTNDLYISYSGKSDGTESLQSSTKIYYAKSTDDGVSWSVDNAYSEGSASSNIQTWVPLCGSRFATAWRQNAGDNLNFNYVNSVSFSAVTSFEYTASGKLVVGSSSDVKPRYLSAASGNLLIGSGCSSVLRLASVASGVLTLAGSPLAALKLPFISSGKLVLGSSADRSNTLIHLGSGVLILGGNSSALQTFQDQPGGRGTLGGQSECLLRLQAVSSGFMTIGGACDVVFTPKEDQASYTYVASGSLVIGSAATGFVVGEDVFCINGTVTLTTGEGSLTLAVVGGNASLSVVDGVCSLDVVDGVTMLTTVTGSVTLAVVGGSVTLAVVEGVGLLLSSVEGSVNMNHQDGNLSLVAPGGVAGLEVVEGEVVECC